LLRQKIGILSLLTGVLLSAAVIATPNLNVANAQDNQTGEMKQTGDCPSIHGFKILKDKNQL
jgi:hypothetical protein